VQLAVSSFVPALWPTLLAMGESAAAVSRMERGASLTRWWLGYPDSAMTVIRDAQRLADELRHAQSHRGLDSMGCAGR
jgi:hypothetical protein